MLSNNPKVLITGAGGPSAVAAIRALSGRAEVYAVDIDPLAVGLYLVDSDHRGLVKRGDDPYFVEHVASLVRKWNIDVLIPTVDSELTEIAREHDRFVLDRCGVMVPDADALVRTLDKFQLCQAVGAAGGAPRTVLVNSEFDPASWSLSGQSWPAIVKPRAGSGGRGVRIVNGPEALAQLPGDDEYILQELLPGDEISVDVLRRRSGEVVAAVPRSRLKVDSGIAIAGQTLKDDIAINIAKQVVVTMGLVGPLNVQLKRDGDGNWKLLEINPRLPGSSPLTMAAGVDLVGLALGDLLGDVLADWYDFEEVAMVRHWEDIVIPAGEFDRTLLAARASLTSAGS